MSNIFIMFYEHIFRYRWMDESVVGWFNGWLLDWLVGWKKISHRIKNLSDFDFINLIGFLCLIFNWFPAWLSGSCADLWLYEEKWFCFALVLVDHIKKRYYWYYLTQFFLVHLHSFTWIALYTVREDEYEVLGVYQYSAYSRYKHSFAQVSLVTSSFYCIYSFQIYLSILALKTLSGTFSLSLSLFSSKTM